MKNVDPKLMSGALIAIIVLCLVVVLKIMGVGANNTPPPIMAGGPTSGASLSLPSGPAGSQPNGGATMGAGGSMILPTPSGGGATPGGSMTLPTPSSPR